MKQFIRKISAVGTSVAMLGMTVGGAVAADLAELPAPFVADGNYVSTAMVIGSSSDASARNTLKTYFDGSLSTGSSGGVVTYNDDHDSDDDILMDGDDSLVGFGEIDSGMIDTLFEGEIEVNDTDYTAREIINFTAATNITTSFNGGQEEMGSDPYLTYMAGSMEYGYAFSDAVPVTAIDTSTETLDLSFLGKSLEIKSSTTSNTVVLDVAETVSLDTAQSTTYKGHTVTLVRVYTSSAAIDVDGEEEIISTGSSKDFGDDVTVEVDTVGEADDPSMSSAVLKLTEQGVATTVTDGDAFELFTDYDTNSHSPWVWEITSSTGAGLTFLGIENRWDTDDLEPSQDYKEIPITVGERVMYPNDYAAVVWDSQTTENYATFTVTIDDSRDLSDEDDPSTKVVDNEPMMIFTSGDGDYFELSGADYHTVYVVNNATNVGTTGPAEGSFQFWGEDDDGFHHTTGTSFKINFNDDDNDVTVGNTSSGYTTNLSTGMLIDANDWDITIPWNYSTDFFGAEEGVDEATDIIVDSTNVGTKEYDVLLADGSIVMNPDSKLGSDKVEFMIPDQDVESTFKVYTVAGVGDAVSADLVTASEDTSGYSNLVLVGGPAVNSVTADFMGVAFPSYGSASGIAADTALVEMVEKNGQTALIVAGWETADTQRGASSVAAGGLSGASHIA